MPCICLFQKLFQFAINEVIKHDTVCTSRKNINSGVVVMWSDANLPQIWLFSYNSMPWNVLFLLSHSSVYIYYIYFFLHISIIIITNITFILFKKRDFVLYLFVVITDVIAAIKNSLVGKNICYWEYWKTQSPAFLDIAMVET